jgi:hypothetical protein
MANATLPVQIIAVSYLIFLPSIISFLLRYRCVQAIDTGTTLIYVPDSIASALYRSIPGAKPANQYGDGKLGCTSDP